MFVHWRDIIGKKLMSGRGDDWSEENGEESKTHFSS